MYKVRATNKFDLAHYVQTHARLGVGVPVRAPSMSQTDMLKIFYRTECDK